MNIMLLYSFHFASLCPWAGSPQHHHSDCHVLEFSVLTPVGTRKPQDVGSTFHSSALWLAADTPQGLTFHSLWLRARSLAFWNPRFPFVKWWVYVLARFLKHSWFFFLLHGTFFCWNIIMDEKNKRSNTKSIQYLIFSESHFPEIIYLG